MADAFGPSRRAATAIGGDQLDWVLQRLDALPTFPRVLVRAVDLSALDKNGGAPPTPEVLDLLAADPALATRVLSAAGADAHGPVSLTAATDRLGPAATWTALLSVPGLGPMAPDRPADGEGMDYAAFWKHSVAVACCTQALAARLQLDHSPEETYLCGLLHDIGKLALAQAMPRGYRRVSDVAATHEGELTSFERAILGSDHVVFGRRLAEAWHLPERVRDVIWLHHQPVDSIPPRPCGGRLAAVVALADSIVRHARLGDPQRRAAEPPAERAAKLGLGGEDLREITDHLPADLDRRIAALGANWSSLDGGPVPALRKANRALVDSQQRLGSELAGTRGRARAFDLVGRFLARLRSEAGLSEVLSAAAELTASARGESSTAPRAIVAYAVQPQSPALLAVRWQPPTPLAWQSLNLLARPQAPCPDGPVEQTLWPLLAEVADLGRWIDPGAYRHRALRIGSRWIGGLLFPVAPAGDAIWADGEALGEDLLDAMAAVLSAVGAREAANRLNDDLAGASQRMSDSQRLVTETRTLEAVGEMAAGAAHEINNPLAVIKGRAQLMAERADDEKARTTWRMMSEQAQRISDIISDLMEFASPPKPRPMATETDELLRRAAEGFASSDHPKAQATRVDIHIREDTPPVFADPRHVQQALLALLTNAADAEGPRGRVRLEARADEIADAVLLSVTDRGSGMDEQTLASAFTPFFSSQQAGRGRGLGLPRAKRYVERNGGRIWVRTQPGQGTTAYILLPAGHRPEETPHGP